MSTIAYAVITASKNNHSILNWDGCDCFDDLIENIRSYVSSHTGWKYLSVNFENNILSIYGKSRLEDSPEYLLSYNVKTGKEIYGRLRQVGFYSIHIEELKKLLSF